MTRRLFVCHATADIEATSELVDALENALNFTAGSLWTSGLPGSSVEAIDMPALGAALAGSDVVLALVTQTSVQDAQFHFQLGAAWALGAHTVLFLLDAAAQEQLPPALSQASVMRGHEPSQWSELIGDLSVRLGLVPRPRASAAPTITPLYPPGSLPAFKNAPPPLAAMSAPAHVQQHSAPPPLPAAPVSRTSAPPPLPTPLPPTAPRVPPLPAAALRAPSVPPLPAAIADRAIDVPPLRSLVSANTDGNPTPLAAQTLNEVIEAAELAHTTETSLATASGPAYASEPADPGDDDDTRELTHFNLGADQPADLSDDGDTRELAHFNRGADQPADLSDDDEPTDLHEGADTRELAHFSEDDGEPADLSDDDEPADLSEHAIARFSASTGEPADLHEGADTRELAHFSEDDGEAADLSEDDGETADLSEDDDELSDLSQDALAHFGEDAEEPADLSEDALAHFSEEAANATEPDDDTSDLVQLSEDAAVGKPWDTSEPVTTPKGPMFVSAPAAPEQLKLRAAQPPDQRLQPRAASSEPSVTPRHSYIDELRAIGSSAEEPVERTPPRHSYIDELQSLVTSEQHAAADEEPDTREQLRIAAREADQAALAQASVVQASDSDVFARLPSCEMALEAGRAVSDCMFNRDEIDDFGGELDVPLGRLIECLGASWSELRGEQDLDTWVAVTDHLLETLPEEVRKVEEWYRVGYELATLHNLAGQLVLDGSDAAAEQHWRAALERFLMRAERAEIGYENLGRVLGLLENLVGPSHERDLSNIPRSLEELRRYAAGADIHTAA